MKKLKRISVLGATVLGLGGCAAVGVIQTDDPQQKLRDAQAMIEQNRPIPAERFIVEAIDICQQRADRNCLANGYRMYGIFFLWAGPAWAHYADNGGFRDKSASYAQRYSKSTEYFIQSRDLLAQGDHYDELSNVNLNLGFAYGAANQLPEACQAFDASLLAYRENIRRNPGVKVILSDKYATYDSYILIKKTNAGCPTG